MAYLVVDRCGKEKIFQDEPKRDSGYWTIDKDSIFNYPDMVFLPKGTIKKLIGREMSWEDDPIDLYQIKV